MINDLVIGGLYQHYKGKNYRLINLARHSETLEWLVVYECLYDNPEAQIWVRPLAMFCETVEVNDKIVKRFNYIGNQKSNKPL